MNFKPTKHSISNHLEYDWFKYLIIVALSLFVVIFSFGRIAANKNEETFTIFFSSYALHSNEYSAKVLQGMASDEYDSDKYGAPILRSVSLNYYSPLMTEYSTLLATQGMQSSDAIIIGKNYLVSLDDEEAFTSAATFLELNNSMLNDMGIATGYELLRLDESFKRVDSGGRVYGIRIDTLNKINNLAIFNYESNESEFYLMLFDSGKNVGQSIGGSDPSNRQGFYCLKIFFELYGN